MKASNITVIISGETSGAIRDAFLQKGFNAISNDLCNTDVPGPHIKTDMRNLLKIDAQLHIFHPTCRYLSSSGLHHNKNNPDREKKTIEAVEFVKTIWTESNAMCKALENPIGRLSTAFMKPTQIIQPWQFNEPESKATCLWLHNLPLLKPTGYADFKEYRCKCGNVFPAEYGKYGCCETAAKPKWNNQTKSGQNKLSAKPDRWKLRSKTYQGIADAIATQWGNYLLQIL